MYKHHSYNNIIERKLEQLPGADTAGLWSSMEAILDQQMPQKKRKPGLMGWLFTHKAWMLVALSAVSVAGFSLVYLSGNDRPTAQQLPAGNASETNTAATAPTPSAAVPATQEAAGVQPVTAPATASTTVSSTTTTNTANTTINNNTISIAPATNNNTINMAAATTAARNQKQVSSSDINTTADRQTNTDAAVATTSSDTKQVAVLNGSEARTNTDNNTVIHWAATTRAIVLDEKTSPAVDPDAVVVNTEALEHLSQQTASASAAAAKKKAARDEKGPYVGLMVGVDMSSVKFQSMETGHNKGIILGYAINRFWSVESGLLWDKKKYYSEGANVNAPDYIATPGSTVKFTSVTGTNQLYELPVNVKYNILAGRHKLFATAGVSSYFMKRETYNYEYELNGQSGMNHYFTPADKAKNWFSIANFSLGYTHKLGNFGSVRVEPYVKLPLRDVGSGAMRVTSTGLNVGFTKPLKRN